MAAFWNIARPSEGLDRFRILCLIAAGGSAALLAGALIFQALGFAPCPMCLWQRWPHVAAVGIGAVALLLPAPAPVLRGLALAGAAAAACTSALGLYHTGVERDWWQGPTSCTSSSVQGVSASDLLNQIMAAPLVRCDEVAWQFLGLSMASWNAVFSLGLVLVWLAAARRAA
ncbi:disulfide bond formation protein B [Frigidibacter oleivorans]|uniref:disulfide bond formation protein B n=1 Tax=Frigidibacter oleivorans TaxID=2487129 RepID=UPI00197A7D90|nr:disulfide bond formation protein B [Frigidibacter oleivorans]